MNRREFAALQKEAVNNTIASVPAHDVAVGIDAVGARIGRSGKVESGERTAAKEERVSRSEESGFGPGFVPDAVVAHGVTCIIDSIQEGYGCARIIDARVDS